MSIYGDEERRGRGGWVRRHWRALAAELVSTALLVLFGCGSCLTGEAALANPAFGFGFIVLANCMAFGAASGAHMNPAVSLAAALAGNLEWALAAAYAVVQCIGSTLGFVLLFAVSPAAREKGGVFPPGTTDFVEGSLHPAAATAVEALLTGMLLLAVTGLWAAHDARRPDHAAPLKLGLVVAGLVFAGGKLTGASLNPARSLGPAIVQNHWHAHYVYWAGPLCGAALAVLLQRALLPPAPAPAPARAAPPPETLPLHDK